MSAVPSCDVTTVQLHNTGPTSTTEVTTLQGFNKQKVIVVLNNKETPMHDTSLHVLVRHCGVRTL